jgi:hypothetical protein
MKAFDLMADLRNELEWNDDGNPTSGSLAGPYGR